MPGLQQEHGGGHIPAFGSGFVKRVVERVALYLPPAVHRLPYGRKFVQPAPERVRGRAKVLGDAQDAEAVRRQRLHPFRRVGWRLLGLATILH